MQGKEASTFGTSDEAFERLKSSDSKSLLKKYLTDELYDEMKDNKTKFGSTLLDVIKSGCVHLDSSNGVYAPDWESYSVFAPLLDSIIREYHGVRSSLALKNPPSRFGDVTSWKQIDVEGKYVLSTRVRVARNLKKIPMNSRLKRNEYIDLENEVRQVVEAFTGDLSGKYHSLAEMDSEVRLGLVKDHLLFKEGDKYLDAADATRFWPTGRGIFVNQKQDFLIWVGEEDHLRIISLEKGGNLGAVVNRLKMGLDALEGHFTFAHDDKLGFITFCPTNLGSTVRSSVHIRLPKLSADMKRFKRMAGKYNLQIRGTQGEHSDAVEGVYDVSNKRRFGIDENTAISEMYTGCLALIEEEKSLEI